MGKMKTTKIKRLWEPLPKVLTVCACCLSLASALFPFSTVTYFSIIPEDTYRITYWSYKATISYLKLGQTLKNETALFNNYWFAARKPYSPPPPTELGASWVLVGTLLTQILTPCTGVAALFTRKRIVQFLPFILCLSVIVMMVYVMVQAHTQTYTPPSYGLGYWLTYPSTLLFITAFTLHRARKTPQRSYRKRICIQAKTEIKLHRSL